MILKKRGLLFEGVAFIGNDLNDEECIKKAGRGIHNKREGAVREICDLIRHSKKIRK